MARTWPPPEAMEEDDDDPDGCKFCEEAVCECECKCEEAVCECEYGCEYCDSLMSPMEAYYVHGHSYRDSRCIANQCSAVEIRLLLKMDEEGQQQEQSQEEVVDKEMGIGKVGEDLHTNSQECPLPAVHLPSKMGEDEQHEQSQEEADEEMGIGKVGEDLNTNSQECPSLPAVPLPSPCLSPGWGSHLPSSLQQNTPGTLWRPWGPVKDSPTRMKVEELGAAASFLKSLVTPHNPYFSSVKTAVTPCQPKRVIRKARKRRSPGELARRRSRLFSYQFNQTPFTPYTPEPDVSRLESGSRGGGLSQRRLDWSSSGFTGEDGGNEVWGSRGLGTDSWRTPLGHREPVEQYSNQTNNNLLYPPLPKTWWPSPSWVPTSSPGPPPPPACPPGYTAPPSPAYCDGCHRWGNLLAVTVSQTRGL